MASVLPYTEEAYKLLHDGSIALAEIEAEGIHVDEVYLESAMRKTKRRIARVRRSLEKTDVMCEWRKIYRGNTKLTSTEQLAKVLFEKMGLKSAGRTPSGRFRTDEAALKELKHPFITGLLRMRKLEKALSTYLRGLARHVVDGRIHPVFNLHTTLTYRSSSDSPNFQNIPIRDPEFKQLVRRAFVPRANWRLVDVDYGGIEVRVAACYHKDPAMLRYIKDPASDLHRDMAMECYMLPAGEVTKDIRYCGKNSFVFPEFYGDWYIDCTRALWGAIQKMKLTTVSGVPLREHLCKKGITRLGALSPKIPARSGSFEHHIKEVERAFWEDRFPDYNQWKIDWFEKYKRQGWLQTLTGFICQGFMKRNEIINYPVQGSAFHCLLWSLIRIVRELRRRKMRTRIVGQIHDSIVADSPPDEVDDFLGMAQEIAVDELKRAWEWLIVPLEIDAEVCPVGASWADTKPYKVGSN